MNLGVGDYYSIVGNRYVKQANVEVIGVDSKEPYVQEKMVKFAQSLIYQSQKNLSREPVIKEEEIQYDLQQSFEMNEKSKKEKLFNKLRNKSEVNSVYLKDEGLGEQYPTYSLIVNNETKNRDNIKQKLKEIQKLKLKSDYHEDFSNDEKELYSQLQRQKKKRMDLQNEYKKLLSRLQNTHNETDGDEHEKQIATERKRQYSRRSFEADNQQKILISCQSARLSKPTLKERQNKSTQFFRISEFNPKQDIQKQRSSLQKDNIIQLQQQSKIKSSHSRNSSHTFQENLIQHLKYLHQKIEKIDCFLTEKQKMLENQALRRQIAEKEREIQRIKSLKMNQSAILQQKKTNAGELQTKKQITLSQVVHTINHADSTALYMGCLIIMVVIVLVA